MWKYKTGKFLFKDKKLAFTPWHFEVLVLLLCNSVQHPPIPETPETRCHWNPYLPPPLMANTVRTSPVKTAIIHNKTVSCNHLNHHELENKSKTSAENNRYSPTKPFSITLLSMITALERCSQIISQKWPQVFLKGPCNKGEIPTITWLNIQDYFNKLVYTKPMLATLNTFNDEAFVLVRKLWFHEGNISTSMIKCK